MIIVKLLAPVPKNRLRCTGRIGIVIGNQKGYCKNRGLVARIIDDPSRKPGPYGYGSMGNVQLLCQRCFDLWKMKHPEYMT